MPAWAGLSAADLPIEATYPARHCLVGLGRLQRSQTGGSYQDHLVIAPAPSLLNPGDPGPPRAVVLVTFPAREMADGAAEHAAIA